VLERGFDPILARLGPGRRAGTHSLLSPLSRRKQPVRERTQRRLRVVARKDARRKDGAGACARVGKAPLAQRLAAEELGRRGARAGSEDRHSFLLRRRTESARVMATSAGSGSKALSASFLFFPGRLHLQVAPYKMAGLKGFEQSLRAAARDFELDEPSAAEAEVKQLLKDIEGS
jgi:hypothetical protein